MRRRHISTKNQMPDVSHIFLYLWNSWIFLLLEYLFYFWIFLRFFFSPLLFIIIGSQHTERKKKAWRLTCVHMCFCAFVCDRWWSHGERNGRFILLCRMLFIEKVSNQIWECCASFFFCSGSHWQQASLHRLGITFLHSIWFLFRCCRRHHHSFALHVLTMSTEHPILTSWWMHLLCMHISFGFHATKWNFWSTTTTKMYIVSEFIVYGERGMTAAVATTWQRAEWIICIRRFLVYGNSFCVFREYSRSCFAEILLFELGN